MEKRDGFNVGRHQHLPLTAMVSNSLPFLSRTVLPYHPQSLGERQKVHYIITFLLVLAEEEATRDRKYGLSTIWVNPCQARVPSMEEAVGKLHAWVSSGPDWPYTLVQLDEDAHHVPLPKEGHLGIIPQRGADVTASGQISQLEVCQLFVSGPHVAYPIGLNGCEEPIITSLLESLAKGISLTEEQSAPAAPPVPVPKQSPRPKRWHHSPDPVETMPLDGTSSKTTSEGPPSSKQ